MTRVITIFHSPDADDAFMFYGLVAGQVSYPGYEFRHELCDIQTLNEFACRGEVEVSAASVHAFAHLKGYAILRCGASMGGPDYGPRLVTKGNFSGPVTAPRTISRCGQSSCLCRINSERVSIGRHRVSRTNNQNRRQIAPLAFG